MRRYMVPWPQAAAVVGALRRTIAGTAVIPMGPHTNDAKAPTAEDEPYNFHDNGFPKDLTDDAAHQAAREALIADILSRDKEVFELKRQHELSMLRVEQHQRRILKDQEDRGMYYEQNCNVHTFDTISTGLHSQRSTMHHTTALERLRNAKIFVAVMMTLAICAYLYYRYIVNPEWAYVEEPLRLMGSRVLTLQEARMKLMTEEEKEGAVRKDSGGFRSGTL